MSVSFFLKINYHFLGLIHIWLKIIGAAPLNEFGDFRSVRNGDPQEDGVKT